MRVAGRRCPRAGGGGGKRNISAGRPTNTTLAGTGWDNTEYRSYEFDDPEGDDPEARIRETKPSWRKRRGSAIGLTSTEQQQMRAVVIEAYKKEFGYPNGDAAE